MPLSATREVVALRRQLYEDQPDACGPDLAFVVHTTSEEAIRILAPLFHRQPVVYDLRMRQLVRGYLTYAEATGRDPDGNLSRSRWRSNRETSTHLPKNCLMREKERNLDMIDDWTYHPSQ